MAREEGLKNIVSELPIADTDSGITAPKIDLSLYTQLRVCVHEVGSWQFDH